MLAISARLKYRVTELRESGQGSRKKNIFIVSYLRVAPNTIIITSIIILEEKKFTKLYIYKKPDEVTELF